MINSKWDGVVKVTAPDDSVETRTYKDGKEAKKTKKVNRADVLVAVSSDGEEDESPTGPARREQSEAGDAAVDDRVEEEKEEDEEEAEEDRSRGGQE